MEEEVVEGVVEKITFQNPGNDYTVARVRDEAGGELVTVVGSLPGLAEGEQVSLTGTWGEHPRYGRQFMATGFRMVTPTTVDGIRRFLGSGVVRGIGEATAARIVERFGERTLEMINDEPERLLEVRGIGQKRLEAIVGSWREKSDLRDLMVFLHTHGLSGTHAARIRARFGSQSIHVIIRNPYALADEVWGIGFQTADRIARKLGIDLESPERLVSGLRYALGQAVEREGHVWVPGEELVRVAAEALSVEETLVESALRNLPAGGEVVIDEDRVYLSGLYRAEVSVSRRLVDLTRERYSIEPSLVEAGIERVEKRGRIEFDAEQKEAIGQALEGRLFVLTGGPGTGKTTVTLAIIDILESLGKRVLLAAPTGRASKKLSEITGRTASTIHRMLEFNAQTRMFLRNEARPLSADVVLVDEVSMVDLVLMDCLLRAIPPHASVILVGDADQLPSVGAGNVLRDLLFSGVARSVKLEHIFRQHEQSMIVINAHRINHGEYPRLAARPKEFAFIEEEKPERIPEIVRGLCQERLPGYFHFDPIDDIQVLSPMYRGPAGATHLNLVLQSALNGDGMPLSVGGQRFRLGDKVMQVRNNYEKEVFNGDLGRIIGADGDARTVHVAFDNVIASYRPDELEELVLAYAVTVHKAQGSEYRAVVLPVVTQHYVMLQRNLLYTAVTRARDVVVLVGSKRAVGIAVRTDRAPQRYSHLANRLRDLA